MGNAAKQISELINVMQEGSNIAVNSMEKVTDDVEISAKSLEEVVISINKVIKSNNEIVEMVESIAAATQEEAVSIKKPLHLLKSVFNFRAFNIVFKKPS